MKQPLVYYKHIILAFALLAFLPLAAKTQTQKKDNLGKEFYVAFAENHGSGDEELNFFALYITSKVATRGLVEVPGLNYSQTFTTTPGTITTIELPDGKKRGQFDPNFDPNDPTVEITTDEQVVAGMAVHVTSDDDIALYGISSKQYSTDAFMALPVAVLGTEYRTINYTSSSLGDTPGEFWVVAVADTTTLTITPKATTRDGAPAGVPFKVKMNRGDVYLVQGEGDNQSNDLTGSLIESDQSIAVLSGHVRTEIPFGARNNDTHIPSRNHLVEQLPPVSAWGDSALVVPYSTASLPDLVRVVSSEDANKITVNGTLVKTLNAGDYYEITALPGPTSIQGTSPILVGQYLHTSQYSTDPPPGKVANGDPAYALVFPVEQFDTSYTFIEAQRDLFKRNFVNIVADPGAVAGMLIDGTPIASWKGFTAFKPIPGSNYVYAQVEILQQGSHNLSAPKPFGITVYALGPADAYSYTGGSLLKTITPFKTVDVLIDFGDRVLSPPGPPYNPAPGGPVGINKWDTTVYLQNISSDPYTINGFATQGGNAPDSFIVTKWPSSIAPSAVDSITIEFIPGQANIEMSTTIKALTEHLRAYVVNVKGRGILENAQIYTDSTAKEHIDTLDFGVLDANVDPAKDSFVYVFNKGEFPLSITGESINPSNALTTPTDFTIQSTTVASKSVSPPYSLPGFNNLLSIENDTSAKIMLRFTPVKGEANGLREAELNIDNTGLPQKVILLATIKTIQKSTVQNVAFDTAFLCQNQSRSLFIDNPNDFPVTVNNVTLGGANSADFSVITPTPLVIPPSSRGEIQLQFAPNATGYSSAQAIVSFDLPKGFADTLSFTAFGDQFTSSFWARDDIHILPGDEVLFPIYAKTPMEEFNSPSFVLTLTYDSTYIEDYDYVQENTLTANGSYTVDYSTPGFTQYFYQTLDNSPVSGGGDTNMPLLYIKFKSHGEGINPLVFHKDVVINYNVQFDHAPVPAGCILSLAPPGKITLDSSCETVYLRQDTFLYPVESFIEPVRPNPVTGAYVNFVFDIPTVNAEHSGASANTPTTLDLIDENGNRAAAIISDERKPGTYELRWNAAALKPGMYYVRLQTPGQTKLRKMVVQR